MSITFEDGKVAERFNAAVLKTVEGASPPRVRISVSPPLKQKMHPCGAFFVLNNEMKDSNSEERVRLQDKGRREYAGQPMADCRSERSEAK